MKSPVTPIVAPALPHSHFHTAIFNYAFFICFLAESVDNTVMASRCFNVPSSTCNS